MLESHAGLLAMTALCFEEQEGVSYTSSLFMCGEEVAHRGGNLYKLPASEKYDSNTGEQISGSVQLPRGPGKT